MRCGCGVVAFIFSIYLKPVLYADIRFNAMECLSRRLTSWKIASALRPQSLSASYDRRMETFYQSEFIFSATVLNLSKLKKITATQPHRTVFKYFAKFKNVAHSFKPGETPSISASHQASNYVKGS